jgi:bifunctional UDP-N-acetylglucosamine pyrophosphorylase/glucosamine-1-phosphate N-acetyltransferase
MRNLHAVILAAGEGTRMKSELPKVLHQICGRPMIAYALDLAASSGVKQPVVVLGQGVEAVKPHLPKEVQLVLQPKRLGTGDAVLAAKKTLKGSAGDVLILYADTPLLRRTTVQKLVETHFKSGATCTLLTAHLAAPSGYGRILRNENSQVVGIVEEAEANAAQRAIREINVGPLVCKLQALTEALATLKPSAAKKELYLTDIISHIARQEGAKIQVTRVEEVPEALGINSRVELARAIGVIRQRIVDAHLHNGVTIEDPQTTFIDHGVSIGADTVIRPYTVIETGVTIGKRCSIGPFARLRSGVSLADEVRVGNFAELVRTKVGPRVRINHVAYLGDATLEEGVNIGAGTITANFDGTTKHPTHIGKGAFIGSDTILIAPVKVGAGAVTGAGCVVTKDHDVPAKGVVIGVPARALDHRATDGAAAVVQERKRPLESASPLRRPTPRLKAKALRRPTTKRVRRPSLAKKAARPKVQARKMKARRSQPKVVARRRGPGKRQRARR